MDPVNEVFRSESEGLPSLAHDSQDNGSNADRPNPARISWPDSEEVQLVPESSLDDEERAREEEYSQSMVALVDRAQNLTAQAVEKVLPSTPPLDEPPPPPQAIEVDPTELVARCAAPERAESLSAFRELALSDAHAALELCSLKRVVAVAHRWLVLSVASLAVCCLLMCFSTWTPLWCHAVGLVTMVLAMFMYLRKTQALPRSQA